MSKKYNNFDKSYKPVDDDDTSQFSSKGLVEQRSFQFVERGGLALAKGFEALRRLAEGST